MAETLLIEVKIMIKRFIPGKIDPPQEVSYSLKIHPQATVLDALEKIRVQYEPGLLYRHSCHHSSCGTCAMVINGREALACTAKIHELKAQVIRLEPLKHFPIIGDLLVDFTEKAKALDKELRYTRKAEKIDKNRTQSGGQRFENCIECGACLSACPVLDKNPDFLGPMILAAYNNELIKNPNNRQDLNNLIYSKKGEPLCDRAIECSRVCPTAVSPARHIQQLRNRKNQSS